MIRHDRREQTLAVCLSALAGYVDAIAFIQLGGFFVSFMSGNSTRLGVGLADNAGAAALAGALIAAFVAGVATGSVLGHFAGPRRRTTVLILIAVLLAFAAGLALAGAPMAAALVAAIAMGAENAVFEREGEVRIGLTYMTGSLVKLGQGLAGAVLGRERNGWLSYLILWAGFLAGALAGAAAFPHFGFGAIWAGAAGAFALTPLAARTERMERM
ncbi:YoaK family protein [Enterovirga sp. GCM10030262]|uniref:YoaK family protein n=1 Tax=Enterovirga sp. GCM10030262 TaxID=3273391 RepID=UPI003609C85D